MMTSCSVSYDDVADGDINSVTKEIGQQFQTWSAQTADGKPVPYDYSAAAAYGKIHGDLAALSVRLSASPDTPTRNMSAIAGSLRDQVEGVWELHARQTSISDFQFFIAEEKLLDPRLAVLSNYEATLKSGASTSSASSNVSKTSAKAAQAGM